MPSIGAQLEQVASDIIGYLPNLIGAILILAAGYFIGDIVGRAVNRIVDKLVEKPIEKTEIGRRYKESGLDLSDITGGIAKAFIFVIALMIALPVLNLGGRPEQILTSIVYYLPKLLGGIIIIVYGLLLVGLLADFIGAGILAGITSGNEFVATLIKNTIHIGLIAVIITIALDLMQLRGELVYPLILGFIIIGLGIVVGNSIIDPLEREESFKAFAPYAKFIVYIVFIMVGLAAVFSNFPGTSRVIDTIGLGIAIAFGIMLIPLVYRLAKQISQQS
ncbi:MAG: hypothetical protein GSR86_06560 [Desulfurococcales archaeon]|nr:hypothetical protein [Desulfurococcales archaeon]